MEVVEVTGVLLKRVAGTLTTRLNMGTSLFYTKV